MSEPRAETQPSFKPAVPPTRGVALTVVFVAAAVTIAAVVGAWTYVTRDVIHKAITNENHAYIDRARSVFEMMRTRAQDQLRDQCRILSEDPRLKATLATEGIDEATVADILNDLVQLRRGGALMVLTPAGRVFAQAGAEELRGLDLSSSSVMQKARASNEVVVGSWVIGKTVMDLAAVPIRSDAAPVAYLVVGQALDKETFKAVATATDVAIALGVGSEIAFASTEDPKLTGAFAAVMLHARQPRGQITTGGQRYVTGFVELEQSATRPYLVLARAVEPTTQDFSVIEWLLCRRSSCCLLC